MKTTDRLLSVLLAISLLLCFAPSVLADAPAFTDVASAAAYIRAAMTDRQKEIAFVYTAPSAEIGELNNSNISAYFAARWDEINKAVFAHTGVSCEGDYLLNHMAEHSVSYGFGYYSDSPTVNFDIEVAASYHTTAEQEEQAASAVAAALKQLDLSGKSAYEKVRAINDYICSHVEYDYANLNDKTYTLKYSAYAALINGTSVCQGYANLFYRMALEAGLDCRIISGNANNGKEIGAHAWNIVRLGGKYYYIDVTWNDGTHSDRYFLVGKDGFKDHYPSAAFTGESFVSAYPISETAFDPEDPAAQGCGGNHNIVTDPAVPATCTQTVVKASGHQWDGGARTKEATCKEEGVTTFTCAVCKETRTEPIPVDPANHADYGTELINEKPATATETGYTGDTVCKGCGAVLEKGEEIPVLEKPHTEHIWDEGKVTKDATCTEEGVTTFTCTVCGTVDIVYLPVDPANHADYGTELINEKPATGTEPGYTGDTVCKGCGAMLQKGEEIPALGEPHTEHVWDEGRVVRAATCTEGGVMNYTCLVCGTIDIVYLPMDPANHADYGTQLINARPATDTEPGYTGDTVCKGCGAVLQQGEEIPIPAPTHTHELTKTEAVAPTCTEDGHSAYYTCAGCGKRFADEAGALEITMIPSLPAKGHSFGDWTVTKPATAEEEGVKTRVCTVCGAVEPREIPRPEDGTGEHRPGDVDGDGEITSADARLALRASVKLEHYEEGSAPFIAADANKDGAIGSDDARMILRAAVKLEDPADWDREKQDKPEKEELSVPEEEEPSEPKEEEPSEPEKEEPSGQEDDPAAAFEQEVIRLVNEERAKQNLPALTENKTLSSLARLKSQDMHDKGYFDHTSPTYGSMEDMLGKAGVRWGAIGENIAMGQRTPQQVVDAWMNSPGHRANILNASFTQIGVGYVAQGNYWTQMFIGSIGS